MISTQSKIFNIILRFSNLKSSIDKEFNSGNFRKGDLNEPPKKIYSNLNIEKSQRNGKNVYTLKPKNKVSSKHILYIHGGAYIHGFKKLHWELFGKLIKATNHTIIAPDYPLAPNYTYKDSFEMVISIYKDLVLKVGGDNIIIMGDSSGGGFALALAESLREENVENAKQIILLSPWLDITLNNKEIGEINSKDPILSINGLQKAGRAYAGDTDPNNYLLSPINGNFEGLGKISVFIGTNDILMPDTRKLNRITKEKGIGINYYEYEDMFHVWMLFNLPESKKAIDQIVTLLNAKPEK